MKNLAYFMTILIFVGILAEARVREMEKTFLKRYNQLHLEIEKSRTIFNSIKRTNLIDIEYKIKRECNEKYAGDFFLFAMNYCKIDEDVVIEK